MVSIGLLSRLRLVLSSGLVKDTQPCKISFSFYDLGALMPVLRQHIGASITMHLVLRH